MKASDYIVQRLIDFGVGHVFGYPGGMVTHLMNSFIGHENDIVSHCMRHEQAAAFAACAYAQAANTLGVAYATSGPGATNLVTGICDAWFDSIPVLFLTGQVNTNELSDNMGVRQRGFQETNIVSMVAGVTKYAIRVDSAEDLPRQLEKAICAAFAGRRGPVLLDIPMNVLRGDVSDGPKTSLCDLIEATPSVVCNQQTQNEIAALLKSSKRPVLLVGNGVHQCGAEAAAREVSALLGMPVVSSLPAVDVMGNSRSYYGFLGAYGSRLANFVVAKSDLVISLGSRMDIRQVGAKRESFAPHAKIVRFDIDDGELGYKVHEDEFDVHADLKIALNLLRQLHVNDEGSWADWLRICETMRNELNDFDSNLPNSLVAKIGDKLPDNALITTDVGQNQIWVAQSVGAGTGRRILFSGGHGAMGYALPAAIGAYCATGKPVFCFTGDGGLQMNVQELQTIVEEDIPIKIIVLNNAALGMIRHFQEMYFDSAFVQTTVGSGWSSPEFSAIAKAYGIAHASTTNCENGLDGLGDLHPFLLDVRIDVPTYIIPKLEFGKPNQDQEPLLPRAFYERLMAL